MQSARLPPGRAIRCVLFDIGETLWTRADDATWERLREMTNRRALAILSEHIVPG